MQRRPTTEDAAVRPRPVSALLPIRRHHRPQIDRRTRARPASLLMVAASTAFRETTPRGLQCTCTSISLSCRSRTEVTGRSSATRSRRCFAASRLLTPTRLRSSDGQGAGCRVCGRPGVVHPAHARTGRCSVESNLSTAGANAPTSSGTHSACASTSSRSSSTWSRSGVAATSSASWLPSRRRCPGIRFVR